MTALKTADIDRFIARPDSTRPVVLVFGPDGGLVRERAELLINKAVDDVRDPFALARLDGDDLAATPTRLVEEANTIPMFGGKRAVWVKAGSRSIAAAVDMLLAAPAPDCLVVIEAGDLKRNDKLRVSCERSKSAAALPCYADGDRDIARLIDDEMREAGLTIAPDARAALTPLLGGDRRATRNELRKLSLYAHGKERVELDDVLAVISDASALALDGIVDAAFAGRTADVETQYSKARGAGTSPASIVAAALRQVAQLHKARLRVEAGETPDAVIGTMTPPLHFRRKSLVETALRQWTAQRLLRAMSQLADANLESRKQASLADAIAQRAMLALATNARRRE